MKSYTLLFVCQQFQKTSRSGGGELVGHTFRRYGNNNANIASTWPLKVQGKDEGQNLPSGSREKPTAMDFLEDDI